MNKQTEKTRTPFYISVLGLIITVVSMFLPILTIKDEFIGALSTMFRGSSGVNLLQFKDYLALSDPTTGTVMTVVCGIIAGCAIIAMLFEITNHPLGGMIFTILQGVVFSLIFYGMLNTANSYISIGISPWVYYIGFLMALVGSGMHISAKRAEKKAA